MDRVPTIDPVMCVTMTETDQIQFAQNLEVVYVLSFLSFSHMTTVY